MFCFISESFLVILVEDDMIDLRCVVVILFVKRVLRILLNFFCKLCSLLFLGW